jgi:hypothetical protein
MLISSTQNSAISSSSYARPKAGSESATNLAPGDVYLPSEPSSFGFAASGTAVGMLLGGGVAALTNNVFGLGGTALAVGLVVAGGITGGLLATRVHDNITFARRFEG